MSSVQTSKRFWGKNNKFLIVILFSNVSLTSDILITGHRLYRLGALRQLLNKQTRGYTCTSLGPEKHFNFWSPRASPIMPCFAKFLFRKVKPRVISEGPHRRFCFSLFCHFRRHYIYVAARETGYGFMLSETYKYWLKCTVWHRNFQVSDSQASGYKSTDLHYYSWLALGNFPG